MYNSQLVVFSSFQGEEKGVVSINLMTLLNLFHLRLMMIRKKFSCLDKSSDKNIFSLILQLRFVFKQRLKMYDKLERLHQNVYHFQDYFFD